MEQSKKKFNGYFLWDSTENLLIPSVCYFNIKFHGDITEQSRWVNYFPRVAIDGVFNEKVGISTIF